MFIAGKRVEGTKSVSGAGLACEQVLASTVASLPVHATGQCPPRRRSRDVESCPHFEQWLLFKINVPVVTAVTVLPAVRCQISGKPAPRRRPAVKVPFSACRARCPFDVADRGPRRVWLITSPTFSTLAGRSVVVPSRTFSPCRILEDVRVMLV